MSLPEPLTPASCDVSRLPFMPLHVDRLLESDLMGLATGDEFKAAIRLWCRSWKQTPAASLPSDERLLASMAGVGVADWRLIAEVALHGFVKCADGRLYHPVIAALALEADEKCERQRERAKTRWARERALREASQSRGNATASKNHAAAMQPEPEIEDSLDSCPISVPENRTPPPDDEFLRALDEAARVAPRSRPSRPKAPRKRAVADESFAQAWAAWPRKDRSAKAKSLALWQRHAADGAAKLAAVRRFLASPDATKESGAYVKAMERWLRDNLDSFLEIHSTATAASEAHLSGGVLRETPAGRKLSDAMRKMCSPAIVAAWLDDCALVSAEPLAIRAPLPNVFDLLTNPQSPYATTQTRALFTALAAAGVQILPPAAPMRGASRC